MKPTDSLSQTGYSLTLVLIFAARDVAVTHFSVCARYIAKYPLLPKIIHSEKSASASALYANPAYEYYSLRASAALIAIIDAVSSIEFESRELYPRHFIHHPTLRARREREKERKQTGKTQNELAAHKRAPLLTLGRKNSRWNEKFKRVAARLSSKSGGWQISAIQARYQPARFPAIDNLSAREIRREFIARRRSRGFAKMRLYYAKYRGE